VLPDFVHLAMAVQATQPSQTDDANRIENTSEQILNIFLLSLGRKDKRYAAKIALHHFPHRPGDGLRETACGNGCGRSCN
jgi:hypothetical protein